MNGEWERKTYDIVNEIKIAMAKVETKVEERHTENKKFFTKLDNLPCDRRIEQTKGMNASINRLYTMLWAIIFCVVSAFVVHLVRGS
jgi:hypothetical protein